MNNNIAFGEDGWYGIAGEDFTEKNVVRLMQAFAHYLSHKYSPLEKVTIAVAFDGRQDSKDFASRASEILAHNGIAVLLSSSVVPTPVLSFATKRNGCIAGIMITGCHYPSEYNGVQFKGAYGGPLLPVELRKIEKFFLESKEGIMDSTDPPHGSTTPFDFLPDYISHLKAIVDVSLLRSFAQNPKNSANVLIDSMGGAGQTIIEDILVGCGWRAQTLFSEAEAHFFDRCPQPIPQNIEPLMYNVSVIDAQFGIATDGDADRCGVIYPDGKWMDNQETVLALLWHMCVQKGLRGGVVKTASVTDKVARLIKAWNGRLLDVGLKGITENLLQGENAFGLDNKGRFIYKNHLLESDGILSGLVLAEMIAMAGKPLHEIMQSIRGIVGEIHCDGVDVPCTLKVAGIFIDKLLKSSSASFAGQSIKDVQISNEQGGPKSLKFYFGESHWFLVRISDAGNILHFHAEGETAQETALLLSEGKNLFNAFLQSQ